MLQLVHRVRISILVLMFLSTSTHLLCRVPAFNCWHCTEVTHHAGFLWSALSLQIPQIGIAVSQKRHKEEETFEHWSINFPQLPFLFLPLPGKLWCSERLCEGMEKWKHAWLLLALLLAERYFTHSWIENGELSGQTWCPAGSQSHLIHSMWTIVFIAPNCAEFRTCSPTCFPKLSVWHQVIAHIQPNWLARDIIYFLVQ